MRDHRPTLSNDIISDSRLANLQKHAQEIMTINRLLKTILPSNMVNNCRAANLRDNQLVLEVASAAIKMKINYDRLNILSQLRSQGFARLIAIEVQINPELYRTSPLNENKKVKPREPISDTAAEYLKSLAESASPKLKARLERLANMAKNKT
ncbi:DciA family protein [Vibrio kasasachensis]